MTAKSHQVSRVVRKIIAPVIPHLAEELYEHDELTNGDTVFLDTWETNVSIAT
jgi:isoleucyl-tRNA synthetase